MRNSWPQAAPVILRHRNRTLIESSSKGFSDINNDMNTHIAGKRGKEDREISGRPRKGNKTLHMSFLSESHSIVWYSNIHNAQKKTINSIESY